MAAPIVRHISAVGTMSSTAIAITASGRSNAIR